MAAWAAKSGHSFGEFGNSSAIHAAGRAIAALASMTVPQNPKTTYNAGTIHGGTLINTITSDADFQLDLRFLFPANHLRSWRISTYSQCSSKGN
ncbi:peptidase dimerization domain-containing protein [Terribacillus aidingensis]|uniref:peptidase dimerization domain-containing protein n=1 Tax=Terribacillus aidingensis TaxID=586416 RepID=UPI000BE4121D